MLKHVLYTGACGFMVVFSGMTLAQQTGVAVLDSGTNDAGVNVVGGFNFVDGTQDTSDPTADGHGTTVSRIVDQESPGVPQYQFVVTDSDLMPSSSATDAAVLRAASNSDIGIIAFSAATISAPSNALPNASQAGKFIAIRTGDGGNDNPDVAAVAASGLSGVAVVTGTDDSGVLLPNSNACGATSSRCVAVRGTTEFSGNSGTSFAAARLAGIAAAVLEAAPFLDAEQLAQVIFATAEDTGDTRLGHGFILNAAQVINSPAGPTTIPDGSGGSGGGSGLAAGALLVGAAAGAAILYNSRGKLEKTLVLDSYGRPFQVDLTRMSTIDDQRSSISSFFESLEQRHAATRIRLDDYDTLDAAYVTSDRRGADPAKYFAFDDDPVFADRNLDWVMSLSGDYPSGFHYQVNKNRDPSLNFGVMDSVYGDSTVGRSRFLSGQSFALPILGFSSSADSVGMGFGGSRGFDVDFGLVNTREDRAHGRGSVAAVLEGSYNFNDRGKLSIQVGRLQEDGSLFGGASNGAFSVDNTDTLAASVSAGLRLGEHAHLIGNYGVARSQVAEANTGLLKNFSSIRSDWFGVGLVADGLLRTRDQVGLAVSQPLRVAGGQVDMSVPYASDYKGNIYRNVDRISLVPNGREYTLESYYLYDLDRRSSLGAYFMLRRQPNHVANAGTELTVLASYRARF